MARFSVEQATDVVAIQQLISDWTHEVDSNAGCLIEQADLLTSDCCCKLADQWLEGRDNIARFYADTHSRAMAGEGLPVIRQLVTNLRVSFASEAEAKVGFELLLFAKHGKVPFGDYCEPVEVADVDVECRREADGHWRISRLSGNRIFRRD